MNPNPIPVHISAQNQLQQYKSRCQKFVHTIFIVILTVFSAYIMINWVLFTTVGVVFNVIYNNMTPTTKKGLAAVFFLIAVYFIITTKEDENEDKSEDNDDSEKGNSDEDQDKDANSNADKVEDKKLEGNKDGGNKTDDNESDAEKYTKKVKDYMMFVCLMLALMLFGSAY